MKPAVIEGDLPLVVVLVLVLVVLVLLAGAIVGVEAGSAGHAIDLDLGRDLPPAANEKASVPLFNNRTFICLSGPSLSWQMLRLFYI
jgi:hypothetical protein